jgi:hypothetical protein
MTKRATYGVDVWRHYAVEVRGMEPAAFDALVRYFKAAA